MTYLAALAERLAGLSIEGSSRFRLLLRQLKDIGWDGSAGSPRILVFTEYRRTQDALAQALAREFKQKYSEKYEDQPRQALAVINGSTPDIHLMKTVEAFATGSAPIRLLLATDVASEGVNLHHECHHIIHYDLPWSIITLIQRNGRIDRLGQKEEPILRYLMVNTSLISLSGDRKILERLISKVEEINRLRKSGESVLRLYDPQAEEDYLARQGMIKGDLEVLEKSAGAGYSEADALEALLRQAQESAGDFNYLLNDGPGDPAPDRPREKSPEKASRPRLFSDRQFFLEGYRLLAEQRPDYLPIEENGRLMIVNPPLDLKRRLGAPDARGDVIFGATAIPVESWPEEGRIRLSDDPELVELAIKAARNMSGYWAREQLCSEQHPVLQWVTERLVMLVRRGEAPLIHSQHLAPGEICFCFIGQFSSVAGSPLVVDAHAVVFGKGGSVSRLPLAEALGKARLDKLVNAGRTPGIEAAQALTPAAVAASLDHLKELKREQEKRINSYLRPEERRLKKWRQRREDLLQRRMEELGERHPLARSYKRELVEMKDYVDDRERNWRDTHLAAAEEPSTQLVLVIVG
ncbi:MAG: helicase-related protein [Pseudomonadota bacterium]